MRTLIDVVPFGIDPEPPTPGPAMRGVVPGIGESDRILLWPGGIWNSFDPLTVIRAVKELSDQRAELRLFFLGVRHPSPVPGLPHAAMAEEAVALARELGLLDRVVFFNFGWVPYAERGRYLLEADIAVSAHFDDVETRFSFRTRLLDCLWAGLPVVTTRGDSLGDAVVAGGAGRSVEFEAVQAWVDVLETMLDDPAALQEAGDAAARLPPELRVAAVLAPLRHLADPRTTPPAASRLRSRPARRVSGTPSSHRIRAARGRRHGTPALGASTRGRARRRKNAWIT